MDPSSPTGPTDPGGPIDASDPTGRRRDRHRAEIIACLAAARFDRAADLGHEHLSEFPDDGLRYLVVAALRSAADPRVRRRATEFEPGC